MPEEYIGVKFNPVRKGSIKHFFKSTNFTTNEYNMMLKVLNSIIKNTPTKYITGGSGNISIRINRDEFQNVFLISCTSVDLSETNLTAENVSIVSEVENPDVFFYGPSLPSSETPMHNIIYKNFKKINIIFHLHPTNLQDIHFLFDFPITSSVYKYGTFEVEDEIIPLLQKSNNFILKDHGIVICGKTEEDLINTLKKLISAP